MAVIQMAYVPQPLNEYSDNLLNYESTFNNDLIFNVVSGSGLVTCDDEHFFEGRKSMKAINYDSIPMVFSTTTDLGATIQQDGSHIMSLRLYVENINGDDPSFLLRVFRNGILYNEYTCLYAESPTFNRWMIFYQTMDLLEGDVMSFSFEFNPAFVNDSIWVDGLKLEFDDRNAGIPTNWSLPINYCCGEENLLISETQWDVTDIGTQTIANGASMNLFTLINNATNKNIANSDTFDQLNIVSNSIRTTYRNCKTIHVIRLSLNITSGSDQHYQLQIRRTIDDSIVYRALLQRNADETIQTIEMTTRTLSEIDPFVVDGFYLAFVNNSGASATIDDALSLVIISNYQKAQKV